MKKDRNVYSDRQSPGTDGGGEGGTSGNWGGGATSEEVKKVPSRQTAKKAQAANRADLQRFINRRST